MLEHYLAYTGGATNNESRNVEDKKMIKKIRVAFEYIHEEWIEDGNHFLGGRESLGSKDSRDSGSY
jgi:uncharacterized protein (DUF1015 family)